MKLEEFDGSKIESLIGYNFKNPGLLIQAFTRSSYSAENPGVENNEVLEFYGDVALNLYVSRSMSEEFGKINHGQYVSEKSEGELSEIRSWYVNKKQLAKCIKVLGLEKYLFLGKSDIDNNVLEGDSVKEDLFESIVGAVVIDCGWNYEKIKDVCQGLFSISDFDENYIALLEEECDKRGWSKPIFFDDGAMNRCMFESQMRSNYLPLGCIGSMRSNFDFSNITPVEEKFSVHVLNLRNFYSEYGSTKARSMLGAAKKYYEFIFRRDKIKEAIGSVDEKLAANQLNELAQKGIIQVPKYVYSESHDDNGNPVWSCSCELNELDGVFEKKDSSKKVSKQLAAAAALKYLYGEETSYNGQKEEK
ncbi:MAG: ribonuclease III family protein [Treponema sp.]|nr:ribonuclease III family protein [Treponema sp.]